MADVRTYIAGLGTTAALVLSAVFAFLAVGAVVGVNSLPQSAGTSGDSVLIVQSNAPQNAAESVADPASAPAPGADGAGPGAGGSGPGPAGSGPAGGPGAGDGGGVPGGPGDQGVPGEPLPPPAPPVDPTPPPAPPGPDPDPPAPPGQQGVAGGLADALDDTLEGVTGVDLGLGESTQGLTDVLDRPVNDLVQRLGLTP